MWHFIHNLLPTDDNLARRDFSITSICSLCSKAFDSFSHIFFVCDFLTPIWRWFSVLFNIHTPLGYFMDCKLAMKIDWSLIVTFNAIMVCLFSEIWKSRNLARFLGRKFIWKSCVTSIFVAANFAENRTKKASNSSIENLCIIKKHDISIHPPKIKKTINILWRPPRRGWK